MALYQLRIRPLSRSAGRSAPAAAAYRAGVRLRDQRTGRLHDHSARRDVAHAEIILPPGLSATEAPWAADRARLWNAAEAAESRRNSRVAREYQVSLPWELTAAQRLALARRFAYELVARHHIAVDLAIHAAPAQGDPRNHHAHLLATTREVTRDGLTLKAGLDLSGHERVRRAMPAGLWELNHVRERWAALTNEALQAAGVEARVDHRSFAAQGVDRVPQPHIPYFAWQMERRGARSVVAERIRQRYRERVADWARARAAPEAGAPGAMARMERLQQRARQAWLARRQAAQPTGAAASAPAPQRRRSRDEDLGL